MNSNEIKYFKAQDFTKYDATEFPFWYLVKVLLVKIRRRLLGKILDRNARIVWTPTAVTDAFGAEDNVRNYVERKHLRKLIGFVKERYPIRTACEVGCGYGRVVMALSEFADEVTGFEREKLLVDMASHAMPWIEFVNVPSLDQVGLVAKKKYDFVLTNAILQHMNDEFCQKVLDQIRLIAPEGHVLIIEKTESISVTENTSNNARFLSRARPVEMYQKMMEPYSLVKTWPRVLEPTYFNKNPGTCMLFRSDKLK